MCCMRLRNLKLARKRVELADLTRGMRKKNNVSQPEKLFPRFTRAGPKKKNQVAKNCPFRNRNPGQTPSSLQPAQRERE